VPTFGNRPDDVLADSQGNVQRGVTLMLYASEADALLGTSQIMTVVTNAQGKWPVTVASYDLLWVRTPDGQVWPVEAGGTEHLSEANADSKYEPIQSTYHAVGGDETSPLNTFLAAASPLGVKKVVGAISVSGTLTLGRAGSYIDMSSATITTSLSASDAVAVTAANVTLRGGTIVSPASWDGTNSAWTYAVVNVTADGFSANGVTLTNVPRVGFGVRTADAKITNCRIVGNYPAGSYTGVETGHFGIQLDPPNSTDGGSGIVSGNHIQSCVQGVSLANYGAGVGYGYAISGNSFYGCHNHGIYQQSGLGVVIDGNAFYRCQIPIVTTGQAHSVTGNTLFTDTTGGNLDKVGISVRDAIDCVVSGNTIIGDGTNGNIAIDVSSVSTTTIARNIISDNVIDVTGSGGLPSIRCGSSTTTVSVQNKIVDNIVRGPGQTGSALILLNMAASSYGYGNVVADNQISCNGNTHGISLIRQRAAKVLDNTIRNEYTAGSATTLIHVFLQDVQSSIVRGTTSVNPSGTGANVTIQVVREDSASSGNLIEPPKVLHETGLAATTPLLIQGSLPTAAAGAGAGASPPAPVVTTNALNHRGNITFGTGTTPAAGAMATVSFTGAAYASVPTVTVNPRNSATQALGLYVSATATGSFTVSAATAPAASQANTVYSFDFTVTP
jgi:hypothetical protein